MTPPRLPFALRRFWRLLEARRALYEGAPERALGALRDPALALSPRADHLRARALDVLFRDAARKAAEGRDQSVARLLGVVAGEDPSRAETWRRHFASAPPPAPGPVRDAAEERADEPVSDTPSHALRDLLAELREGSRADAPADGTTHGTTHGTADPPRAQVAGHGGPPRLKPLEDQGAALRFRLAVDDGGDLFVASHTSLVLGHARAGVADVPVLADLESRHARLTFAETFHDGPTWRLEPLDSAQAWIDDYRVVGAQTLVDGNRVRLAPNLEFTFRRPDPASASALLELLHGAEAEGSQRVLLFVPGATGRVRIGPRTSRHVPVAGIEHEVELALEGRELVVRCGGGVRRLGLDDSAAVEARVSLPPSERVDLVLGARPAQRAPFGLSLLPIERSRIERLA